MRCDLLGHVVDNFLGLAVVVLYAWPKDDIRPGHFGSLAVVLDSDNAHVRYIAMAKDETFELGWWDGETLWKKDNVSDQSPVFRLGTG